MAGTLLVSFPLEDGNRLIEALDSAKFPIQAALWLYQPEMDTWQLVIATPIIEQKGPLEAYRQIRSELENFYPPLNISLSDVTVANPSSNLIRSLWEVVRVGAGEKGVRLRLNGLQGIPVEEAYIYRML